MIIIRLFRQLPIRLLFPVPPTLTQLFSTATDFLPAHRYPEKQLSLSMLVTLFRDMPSRHGAPEPCIVEVI